MKLSTQGGEVSTNLDLQASDFQIKASPQAFKILSSSLYKDKITAVIRELTCNAIDAHTEAKNKNPISVQLPTPFDPTFSVIDQGVGMDEEQVHTLYTTYFSSSKTGTNQLIGALGLGSKSPFAYTDSFNVIAVKDNVRRVFSCQIGPEGTPQTFKISEEKVDASNGVTVSFPVLKEDVKDFNIKAARLFAMYKIMPSVTAGLMDTFAAYLKDSKRAYEGDAIFSGKNWKILKTSGYSSCSIYVRMGQIVYPVTMSLLEKEMKNNRPLASCLSSHSLFLDIGIGDCDIAPSREELDYTTKTIKFLVEALQKTSDGIIKKAKHVAKDVQGSDWSRTLLVSSFFQLFDSDSSSRKTVKDAFASIKVSPFYTLEPREVDAVYYVERHNNFLRNGRGDCIGYEYDSNSLRVAQIKITPDSHIFFMERREFNSLPSSKAMRSIKQYLLSNQKINKLFILADDTLGKLGNPPNVVVAKDIPLVTYSHSSSKMTSGNISYFVPHGKVYSRKEVSAISTSKTSRTYIFSGKGFNVLFKGKEMPRGDFANLFEKEDSHALFRMVENLKQKFPSLRLSMSCTLDFIQTLNLENRPMIIRKEDETFWKNLGARSFEEQLETAAKNFITLMEEVKKELKENNILDEDSHAFRGLVQLKKYSSSNDPLWIYASTESKLAPVFQAIEGKEFKQSALSREDVESYCDRLRGVLYSLYPSTELEKLISFQNQATISAKKIVEENYGLLIDILNPYMGEDKQTKVLTYIMAIDNLTKEA